MELMQYCLKVSEEALEQEKQRGEAIKRKADYLFKWMTFFVSVFNIAVPIIVQQTNIDYKDSIFLWLYSLLMFFLVTAILIIIVLEFPSKVKIYPLGSELLKKAKENPEKYAEERNRIYQSILYKDIVTRQVAKNNDRAIVCITIVNILLILAIICMALFFAYIMLGM